jgi:two-component system, NtrC family, response regulator GlrR
MNNDEVFGTDESSEIDRFIRDIAHDYKSARAEAMSLVGDVTSLESIDAIAAAIVPGRRRRERVAASDRRRRREWRRGGRPEASAGNMQSASDTPSAIRAGDGEARAAAAQPARGAAGPGVGRPGHNGLSPGASPSGGRSPRTDSRATRDTPAAEADGGTLFFDEVHALSLQSQAGLLRFLQDFSFRPLGAERGSRVDVRVVAATNRDLSQGAASAWFREDLYYRLNVAALAVPSLRERASDIPLLVECCIRRYCARYDRPPCRFGDASLAWLAAQPWRGNVRELESLVQRCLLADDGPLLHLEQAGEGGECEGRDGNAPGPMAGPSGPVPAFNLAKAQALAAFERGYLERVLAHHRGNVSAAARQAGKERRVFGRLMKKHGIDRLAFVYPQGESQFQS